MSAPEMGHRATNGAEYAPKPPFESREILSSEISIGNSRVSGGYADHPLPMSCAVTLPVANMLSGYEQSLANTSKGIWSTLALILYFAILYFMVNTKGSLLIKPKQGLIFNGKKLPFSEIQNIGTINYPKAKVKAGESFVYADSHGVQIRVTKYVPLALADAVASEIKQASGMGWE